MRDWISLREVGDFRIGTVIAIDEQGRYWWFFRAEGMTVEAAAWRYTNYGPFESLEEAEKDRGRYRGGDSYIKRRKGR
jgi:hypothetical protein